MPQRVENPFERRLDQLANTPSPRIHLDGIFSDLTQRRSKYQNKLSEVRELEIVAVQAGHLLDLFEPNDKRYQLSVTTNRILGAISDIKRAWGKDFFACLQRANIFLPVRLSRDSAETLRSISQTCTRDDFASVMRGILERPRSKGKLQEQVPSAGGRVVQTKDIRDAKRELQELARDSESSVGDVPAEQSTAQDASENLELETNDNSIELPRDRILSPAPALGLRSSAMSISAIPDSPFSLHDSGDHNHGEPHPTTGSTTDNTSDGTTGNPGIAHMEKGSAASDVDPFDVSEIRTPKRTAAAALSLMSPYHDITRDRKRKPSRDSTSDQSPKLRRSMESVWVYAEVSVTGSHNADKHGQMLQPGVGSMVSSSPPPASPTPTELVNVNPFHHLRPEQLDVIFRDLSPMQRLHGCTVDALIKQFLSSSMIRVVELVSIHDARSTISAFLGHSLVRDVTIAINICTQNHWFCALYNQDVNTVRLIDSSTGFLGAQQTEEWIDQITLGLCDAGSTNPTWTRSEIPQQTNSWDCGLYLVVSILRAIAYTDTTSSSHAIDGRFFRAVFEDFFRSTPDCAKIVHALSGPDQSDLDTDIATRLIGSRAHRVRLEACKSSAQSALELFTMLSHVLSGTLNRLEKDLEQCNALIRTLSDFKSTVQRYERKTALDTNKTYRDVENLASESSSRVQRLLSDSRNCTSSIREITSRLTSLDEYLATRLQETTSLIKQQGQEASQVREATRQELEEVDRKRAQLKSIADQLEMLLPIDL
jgi:hypothetical protein